MVVAQVPSDWHVRMGLVVPMKPLPVSQASVTVVVGVEVAVVVELTAPGMATPLLGHVTAGRGGDCSLEVGVAGVLGHAWAWPKM